MRKKSTMGRPPAAWVVELASGRHFKANELIGFDELELAFHISREAARCFCKKLDISGEYFVRGTFAVKKYRAKDLQDAAQRYIDSYLPFATKKIKK